MNDTSISVLGLAVQAHVPAIMQGEPGTGKTKTAEALARYLKVPLATFIPVVHEPQDIGGYPVPITNSEGRQVIKLMLVGGWLDEIIKRNCGILFIDEFTCSPAMMQAACLRPLDSHMIGEEKLHDDVSIILACNKPEHAAGGQPVAPPMANRMIWLDWNIDREKVIAGFLEGWGEPSFPILPANWRDHIPGNAAMVASFFKPFGHYMHQLPKDEEQRGGPWPSLRSWYDLGVPMLAACDSVNAGWDVKLLALAGAVSIGVAQEFMTWIKSLDLPDPEDLLKHPDKFQVYDSRPDKTFAVLNGVVSAAIRDLTPQRWEAAWRVLANAAKHNATDVAGAAARALALARGGKNLPLIKELILPFHPILNAQRHLAQSTK